MQARVASRTLAEDILQDAFVRTGARGDDPGADESVVTWFFRVLRDAVTQYELRHEVTSRALTALTSELDEETGMALEIRETVYRCIARLAGELKPGHARALQRLEIDGLTIAEYAAEVGIASRDVVGVLVSLAREEFKRQITRSCMTCLDRDGTAG